MRYCWGGQLAGPLRARRGNLMVHASDIVDRCRKVFDIEKKNNKADAYIAQIGRRYQEIRSRIQTWLNDRRRASCLLWRRERLRRHLGIPDQETPLIFDRIHAAKHLTEYDVRRGQRGRQCLSTEGASFDAITCAFVVAIATVAMAAEEADGLAHQLAADGAAQVIRKVSRLRVRRSCRDRRRSVGGREWLMLQKPRHEVYVCLHCDWRSQVQWRQYHGSNHWLRGE